MVGEGDDWRESDPMVERREIPLESIGDQNLHRDIVMIFEYFSFPSAKYLEMHLKVAEQVTTAVFFTSAAEKRLGKSTAASSGSYIAIFIYVAPLTKRAISSYFPIFSPSAAIVGSLLPRFPRRSSRTGLVME